MKIQSFLFLSSGYGLHLESVLKVFGNKDRFFDACQSLLWRRFYQSHILRIRIVLWIQI